MLIVKLATCSIALCLTACNATSQQPVAGFVPDAVGFGAHVGARAPRTTFLDQNGKLRSLSSVYEDATLIIFTKDLCSKKSVAVEAAAENASRNVAFVRVSTCDGECCENHEQCVQTMADRAKRTITLCDGRAVLRRWYGVATSSAVFLLDRYGVVVAEGALADLNALTAKANRLVQKVEEDREALYGG